MADQFFASPHESVRGWERAIDAQVRVVQAVEQIDNRFTLEPRAANSWWRAIDT